MLEAHTHSPIFEREEWTARGRSLRDDFANASPFPHVVIDDALPSAVLDRVLDEFPSESDAQWQRFDNPSEVKLALADVGRMGPATRELLAEFNGQIFLEFLTELTGIECLVSDPYYDGGGLHQIRRGGLLKVHADFNINHRLKLDRRLNALLYLNKDWPDEYGGHLELWNSAMTRAEQRIAPAYNRLVIFATTDDALHGHPEPLSCPPDRARRSMALYYYSNGRPADERTADHTTIFRSRPGERLHLSMRAQAKRWIPPVISDLISR